MLLPQHDCGVCDCISSAEGVCRHDKGENVSERKAGAACGGFKEKSPTLKSFSGLIKTIQMQIFTGIKPNEWLTVIIGELIKLLELTNSP